MEDSAPLEKLGGEKNKRLKTLVQARLLMRSVHGARRVRAAYHTRTLTLRSGGSDSLTWLGPHISILTGLRAKAWCILIHAHRSVSLSRGPGRKPGAPLYTRMRLPLTGSRAKA